MDMSTYESAIETMNLKTTGISEERGIIECNSETFTEFIFEVIEKSTIVFALLYPEYDDPFYSDMGFYNRYVQTCTMFEEVFDNVVTSILNGTNCDSILGYMDILYCVSDLCILEECYEELKRFVHNHSDEISNIGCIAYDKMIKDIANCLRELGYFDKPLMCNVRLGKI